MKIVRDQHRQAIDLAEQAFVAKAGGDDIGAEALFRQAYELERQAAEAVGTDLSAEPTRSVLYRSAATLALDCGEHREAERLIAAALSGYPPEEIAEELRDLLEQVHFSRHLDVRGIVLEPIEFQLSISGEAVGLGIAQSRDFIERVECTEKLLHRTAERKRGQPFRESGPAKQSLREDFDLFLSAPRAASFAVTFRLGRFKDQLRLPETQDTGEVIDEVLQCLELFNGAEEDELRLRIASDAYYRNFTALARRIAPDGQGVKLVGFTVVRDGSQRRVSLTRQQDTASLSETLLPKQDVSKRVTVTGTLRFAESLKGPAGSIRLVDETGRWYKVNVPEGMMADIVKPLWEDIVTVTGIQTRRGIILEDIRRASAF